MAPIATASGRLLTIVYLPVCRSIAQPLGQLRNTYVICRCTIIVYTYECRLTVRIYWSEQSESVFLLPTYCHEGNSKATTTRRRPAATTTHSWLSKTWSRTGVIAAICSTMPPSLCRCLSLMTLLLCLSVVTQFFTSGWTQRVGPVQAVGEEWRPASGRTDCYCQQTAQNV